ncbi:gelatinase b [Fusarium austroafricanum]|uniref:Gelatinase b n=1 Tax=Fusarium austroafricanum TaxID=2364996 RepID=A0A8H4K7M5_9HYPO|nr:gelatinase b [Fusarium austroafricanum]
MWSLYILTALLSISPTTAKKSAKPCPTVTSTRTLCSTCVVPACLAIETISSQRGCPAKVPTTRVSFPCSKSQCPEGCATSYAYASAYGGPTMTQKPACPTVTKTSTICSTCIRPMCITLSTVSSVCGCPDKAATTTVGFPCGKKCPGGCGTGYVPPTVTPNCKKGADDD